MRVNKSLSANYIIGIKRNQKIYIEGHITKKRANRTSKYKNQTVRQATKHLAKGTYDELGDAL